MYAEIARNKHRSVAFVGLFFVVWLGLGVVLRTAVEGLVLLLGRQLSA